jgi:glutamate racemase
VVGVLATGATLGGERFAGLAERFSDGVELLTQACPGLVEQVEAGDLSGPETRALLEQYVRPLLARGADTLVLGCTHYPFLKDTLRELVDPQVALIDTGAAVARQTARVLGRERLADDDTPGESQPRGSARFLSSDIAVAPVIAQLWGAPADVESLLV